MPLVLITPPPSGVYPFQLTDIKNRIRVDSDMTLDDTLIESAMLGAMDACEALTANKILTQTWALVTDAFPSPALTGVPFGLTYSQPPHAFVLPFTPVNLASISITYLRLDGTTVTVPPSSYVASPGKCTRITPVFGQIWPTDVMPQIGAIQVQFTCGWSSDGTGIPAGLLSWMGLRVGTLYQYREEIAVAKTGRLDSLPFVDRLLDSYKMELYI